MPSLFTSNGGLELPADGEQDGVWGDTVNANMQIIDRLTNGVGAITLSGTTHTLTTLNGTPSDGHYAVVVFGGTPSGTNTVTVAPNEAEKVYFVRNTTAQSIVLTQGSGGDVTVTAGAGAIVYADGAGTGAAVVDLTGTFAVSLASLGVTATAAELNILDGATVTPAELNILDGVTASTAELNILDGVTASTAELNILDGVTATTADLNILAGATLVVADVDATAAELNLLDGVTATTAELNILDGVTATTAELNILDGVTATATEINILDGVTATTEELNSLDGVTSPIQAQLDGKADTADLPTLDQTTWDTGTSTTETIISPLKLAAVVESAVPAPTTSQVLTATSGATAGAVGTYAFGRASTSKVLGDTLAGSSITTVGTTGYYETPTSSGYLAITGATLAGTWMCMGRSGTASFQVNIGGGDTATVNVSMSTLWLRIV